MDMKTVVIIPTYNEAENILLLINKILKLKIKNLDILVVDDNSPDGTSIIVKDKGINIIINKKKLGLGNAYLTGMAHAINNMNADFLIEMDADFSHDPKDIKKLIKKINEGYDIIIGSRYIKGGSIPKNWGIHRKFISKFGNKFISFFLGKNLNDWSNGFRIVKKEVFLDIKDKLKDQKFQGYTFQVAFLNEAIKKGYEIGEIPIKFSNRKYGKSKFLGMEYIFNTLKYLIFRK
jgi:dolichol-phosphate mannosyltransferase